MRPKRSSEITPTRSSSGRFDQAAVVTLGHDADQRLRARIADGGSAGPSLPRQSRASSIGDHPSRLYSSGLPPGDANILQKLRHRLELAAKQSLDGLVGPLEPAPQQPEGRDVGQSPVV